MRLVRFLRPYRAQIVLVMALVLLQALANLYLPDLNANIINDGVAKGDTAFIMREGAVMLGVALVLGVISIISVYWGARTAMAFGRDLRHDIFRTVQSFSLAEMNRFGAPSLITRTTNDVQQIQMLVVMGLNVMVMAPFMAVGGVIMAIRQDAPLSLIIVVVIPLLAVVLGFLARNAMPLFKTMQKRVDRVNQVMREKLAGIRVIRAFVRTRYEEQRFDVANRELSETMLAVGRLFALMMPAVMAIMNLTLVATMWFGGLRIDSGAMPIGNLTAFLTYIMQILMSVMMAAFMFVMVPRAAASAERINEVLDTQSGLADPAEPLVPTTDRGVVEFRDVEFRYPGAEAPVLAGVSFTAEPGKTTAIVGSTGSGKSTLVNLIPRFYDVTGGQLLVDGVDVRDMAQAELWRRIGFIPQKAFLFSGTVASNLRYGRDEATDEELWHALGIAQGKGFVAALEDGLDAPITQGGTNVSGGQRQRLAIARALVKRPSVYVFDDSFSALDFKTDAALRAALSRDTADATVIIVAQRVSTIMHADLIVVLEEGRVVGMGTHDQLLGCCPTYGEIVSSQMTEEEVA
ncbi:ABC transporter ATP-binding protein [Anaerosoma tenue]|uniref:ABC transporter ATP-binding protein n=1 Tax=Anaerosoma tenue TaxID=2933588 RepID=UPI002260984F|nr:ABC transporter ATP-binding protein [Anaerosoma tenue]MCK8115776.1 ABC transporter ATP-binding protein/permease [Anaerosoma tenue]